MAPSRPSQPLLLHFLVLLLVAASIGAASAQYASRSRRSLWARARKLFEFPTLHKSQLSKIGFTYEIAKQPAKPEASPSDGATDPASSVAASTPAAPSSSEPSRPAGGSSNDGFSSGGSSSGNFAQSGNPLFPGTVTSTPGSDPKPTPKTPSTPSQQAGDAVAATAVPTQAASPSAPPPPPPPPQGPCPPQPNMCDFYFQGSTESLPVFNISDGAGDTRLGGPIEASIRGATVEVIAANSELADYICQDGVNVWSAPSASSGNSTTLGPDNQFYAVQDGIQSRTFQPAAGGAATYQGKYVRVNLTAIEISVYNMVSNVENVKAILEVEASLPVVAFQFALLVCPRVSCLPFCPCVHVLACVPLFVLPPVLPCMLPRVLPRVRVYRCMHADGHSLAAASAAVQRAAAAEPPATERAGCGGQRPALPHTSTPELGEAIRDNKVEEMQKVLRWMRKMQNEMRRKEQEEQELLSADPFDPEVQRRIEERIQQHMLYVEMEVNNSPIKAFVDSGAQQTIMSQRCAERCGLMRLLDRRYEGVARGVGTSKIVGRIHTVQLKIGTNFYMCSITVLEADNVDFLFGLDMLRRHQVHCSLLHLHPTPFPSCTPEKSACHSFVIRPVPFLRFALLSRNPAPPQCCLSHKVVSHQPQCSPSPCYRQCCIDLKDNPWFRYPSQPTSYPLRFTPSPPHSPPTTLPFSPATLSTPVPPGCVCAEKDIPAFLTAMDQDPLPDSATPAQPSQPSASAAGTSAPAAPSAAQPAAAGTAAGGAASSGGGAPASQGGAPVSAAAGAASPAASGGVHPPLCTRPLHPHPSSHPPSLRCMQATPAAAPAVSAHEVKVQRLMELGFPRQLVEQALALTGDNEEHAAGILFAG
ncbi:unnamed protein product [Closterium sp. Naga37s-1]|nr:unnamed protein product [Closterium sp. Naga37s-1]